MDDDNGRPARLGVLAFGLAFGLATAIAMLILGIGDAAFGWGDQMVDVFASLYIGFSPTVIGTILGMLWGFADGFIGGVIMAAIYNLAVGRRG